MAPNSLFQQGDPGARDGSGISPGRETPELFGARRGNSSNSGGKGPSQPRRAHSHFGMWPEFLFFLTPDSSRVPEQEFPKDSRRGEAEMFHAEFLSLN